MRACHRQLVTPERVAPDEPHRDRAPWVGGGVCSSGGGAVDDASLVNCDRRFERWGARGLMVEIDSRSRSSLA